MLLARVTSEAFRAENEYTALLALERSGVYGRFDLLTVAYDALFNSSMARIMRVYDETLEAASLWYLFRVGRVMLLPTFVANGLSEEDMKGLSAKLKAVRDKAHMHLDKGYVGNPKRAWTEDGPNGVEFLQLVSKTADALREAYRVEFGAAFGGARYGGQDVPGLIEALKRGRECS
jgi:hypothetical protein